jgi:DNA-binding XRE family transcriptional regulator
MGCPVREFLDEFKESNPGDFVAVMAGLGKLRNRHYHRPPLLKPIGDDLFELQHVGRFKKAGEAWDVALQLAALRKESGLSQKELARRVGTSQQQISRLESPSYEGHSLSMLRRVVEVLGATLRVEIQRKRSHKRRAIAEGKSSYGVKD